MHGPGAAEPESEPDAVEQQAQPAVLRMVSVHGYYTWCKQVNPLHVQFTQLLA